MSIDTLLNVYSYHEIKDLGFVVCPAQAEKVKKVSVLISLISGTSAMCRLKY